MRSSSDSNCERAVAGDDDLAVEDAPLGERGPERVGQLREVAVERLQVARLRVDLVAVAEDERPEAVPFRLEQPAVVRRQVVGGLGEHRLERRFEGECHRPTIARRPTTEPAVRSWQGRQRRPRPFASQVPGRRAGEGRIRREFGLALQEDREDRPPFAFRERGECRDQGRHGIVGQDAEIVRVEAGVAARRDQGRIDDPLDIARRDERRPAR